MSSLQIKVLVKTSQVQASILSALLVLISTGPLDLCRSAVSRRVAPIDITTVTQIYQDSEQNGPFGKSQKSLILTIFYQYLDFVGSRAPANPKMAIPHSV